MINLASMRACPRCSVEYAGILISEPDGFVHCLSCGFVIQYFGFKRTPFKELFEKYQTSLDRKIQESQIERESLLVTAWKQGRSNKELAAIYHVSERTIRRLLEETSR
jgi:transcription initiation factor TFIIIB Brf1 subunit/transcription initiation factor TFIIB